MTVRGRDRWLLLLAAIAAWVALSWGIGSRGLFETSEGRYASLAAQMVRSGDWLVPRLNGVKRFEKPPLSIWCMAASVRLFGESELALRLPGALAAFAGLVAAYLMALAGGRREALTAAALACCCPLYFGIGKALTTDVYLSSISAWCLLGIVRAMERPESRGRFWTLAALCAGLGFLDKGPAIWLFTLLPAIGEMVWSRRLGDLRRLLSPARLLLFVLVAAPWFVVVCLKVPGLFGWLVGHRAIGALVSAREFHPGPRAYYVPVFLVGFFPVSLVLVSAGRAALELADRRRRLLLLAVVVPFVTFSLSASKLATYLVPSVVPAAVLAASCLSRATARRSLAAAGLALLLLVVAMAFGSGWLMDLGNVSRDLPVVGLRLLSLSGVLAALAGVSSLALALGRRPTAALVALCVLFSASLMTLVSAAERVESMLGGRRDLVLEAMELAGPEGPIICYRSFVRSIPYYARRDATVVGYYHRDKLDDEEWDAVALDDVDDMRALLDGPAALLCEKRWVPEVLRVAGPLRLVDTSGDFALLAPPLGS